MAQKRVLLDENGNEARTDIEVTGLASDQLVSIAEQAEKRIEAVNKIKRIALRVTNKHDWTDQNGKPYLQASGAEKVARLFGISWIIEEPEKETYDDGHYSYTYRGKFSIYGITIDAIGTRNSRDGFFKKYKYVDGEKTELPVSEIDTGDIKKSAFTNLIGNGITRILGIRNLTWEDLAGSGISRDDVSVIDYKKEGKKQDKKISSEESISEVITITDVRKKEGEKGGKKWVKYLIKSDDKVFSTFSETLATYAKDAKENNQKVKITYKQGQYGNDLETIVKVEEVEKPNENKKGEELFQ